jgi:hypothetical protein
MALETQGYQLQATTPDLSREYPLTSLKALSFSGGGNSPLNVQPLAGWKVESAHPENVAIGAIQGAGAIGQGITAAYLSKQAKKEAADALAKSQAREDLLLGQKYKEEEKMVGIRGKYALDHAELMQGIKDRIPKQTQTEKAFTDLQLPPLSGGDSSESSLPPSPEVEPINTGLNFKGLPTEEIDGSGQSAPSELKFDNKPLGDITSPVPLAAAPSPIGEQALNALGNIDWSKMTASLGVGTGAGSSPVSIPSSQPDWLRSPKSVTGSLSKLGGVDNVDLPLQDQYFAGMQKGLEQTKAPTIPAYERQMNKNYRSISDQQAQDIHDYAVSHGYDAPVLTGIGGGMTEVKWASPEQTEARKSREEAASGRREIQTQNTLNRESAMFQGHPAIKAFTGANGMQQSLPRFIKDYDAIVKNPEGAGISDVGLLDMFARAEGGGRVTEGQANLALGSMGLKDKAMQLGYKLEGGDRLSQNQRDQMLRVISEDHGVQVSLANQAVQMTRNKLMDQGVTNEHSLPQPYIKAKTKWDALNEITEMKKNALAIHEQQKQAEASGDKKTANDLKRQLEDIGKSAKELRSKIDKSKSAIINIDELENTPQGWGGGASGILIQQ